MLFRHHITLEHISNFQATSAAATLTAFPEGASRFAAAGGISPIVMAFISSVVRTERGDVGAMKLLDCTSWALCNLALLKHSKEIVRAGAVPALIQALGSVVLCDELVHIAEPLCWTLLRIARVESLRADLVASGAIVALRTILDRLTQPEIVSNARKALDILSRCTTDA